MVRHGEYGLPSPSTAKTTCVTIHITRLQMSEDLTLRPGKSPPSPITDNLKRLGELVTRWAHRSITQTAGSEGGGSHFETNLLEAGRGERLEHPAFTYAVPKWPLSTANVGHSVQRRRHRGEARLRLLQPLNGNVEVIDEVRV